MTLKIGVLAGMGPRSTAPFIEQLIDQCKEQYGAKNDIDFPEIHIISLPTPFYPGVDIIDSEMILALQKGVKALVRAEVDFISIPCNLAHNYFSEMLTVSENTPILHIADTVLSFLKQSTASVSLLATEPTLESGFYQQKLNQAGIHTVDSDFIRKKTTQLISIIKSEGYNNSSAKALWAEIVDKIQLEGINTVVIACTDLSPMLKYSESHNIDFIDSTKSLAAETIRRYVKLSRI